jgi:hypothetical protein
MLWPLTITCIDESGNRLPGAAIQVRETLNPSVEVPVYDIDNQLVASPVAGPTGMATVFLRNGYIDSRYVLDPYESEWITDLAIAPFGRAGRWQDTVGGAIAAGATTDFPITVPNLGIEKVPRYVALTMDFTHPSTEDLEVQLVHPLPVPGGSDEWSAAIFGGELAVGVPADAPSGAFSDVVRFDDETGSFTDPMDLTSSPVASAGARSPSSRALSGFGVPGYDPDYIAEGVWKLRITDSGAAGGTLNNWTLTFPANLSFT